MFKKILAIDDSDLILKMHEMTLKPLTGAELVLARNGAEGFQALKANAGIECILLDINMPLLDGVSFLRILRNEVEPLRSLPVIAVTTEGSDEAVDEIMAAGANEHVAKPLKRTELLTALRRVYAETHPA